MDLEWIWSGSGVDRDLHAQKVVGSKDRCLRMRWDGFRKASWVGKQEFSRVGTDSLGVLPADMIRVPGREFQTESSG